MNELFPRKIIEEYMVELSPIPSGIEPRGSLSGRTDCVLFDVYGTLFVSGSGDIGTTGLTAADERIPRLARLCRSFGLDLGPEDLVTAFKRGVIREHKRLKGSGIEYPEVEADRIWMDILRTDDRQKAKRFALCYEWITNPAYPMPHAESTIERLASAGRVLGIISNAQFYTPLLFYWFFGGFPEDLGFDRDLLFYSYRFKEAKPGRRMFQEAKRILEEKGIPPSRVLYVGNDMRNDIMPAAKSGFKTALFAGDLRSLRLREEDNRPEWSRPDILITDLGRLPEHLVRAGGIPGIRQSQSGLTDS